MRFPLALAILAIALPAYAHSDGCNGNGSNGNHGSTGGKPSSGTSKPARTPQHMIGFKYGTITRGGCHKLFPDDLYCVEHQ